MSRRENGETTTRNPTVVVAEIGIAPAATGRANPVRIIVE